MIKKIISDSSIDKTQYIILCVVSETPFQVIPSNH